MDDGSKSSRNRHCASCDITDGQKNWGIVSTIAIATIYYNQSPALIVHIILCTEPHVGMG